MSISYKIFKRFGVLLCLLSCWFTGVKAQQVTISNNLLYDAWLTPNLRVGVRLSPHLSIGATAGYRPWPTDDHTSRKWRHLLLSPDLRYWTDSVNVHHFFGVNLIYSHYNVADLKFPFGLWKSVRNERREGDLGALGAFYGYSWPIGRYLNIEALIGGAIGYTKFTSYACGHCGTKIKDDKKWFFLPQAALNIVFNIPGRTTKTLAMAEPDVIVPPAPPAEPVTPKEVKPEPVVVTPPAPTATVEVKRPQYDNPILSHVSEYKPYDRSRVLRKEKDALFVYFPLGKTALRSDYRDNGKVLERIIEATRQIMNDTASTVKVIQIVGLASVEGPEAGNERLATARAKALQKYIQERVDVPDALFETVGGGEAWADFTDQLTELSASNSELKQAVDIVKQERDPAVRVRKLQRLNGGRTWQYIRRHILYGQRYTGYIRVYYDYVDAPSSGTK